MCCQVKNHWTKEPFDEWEERMLGVVRVLAEGHPDTKTAVTAHGRNAYDLLPKHADYDGFRHIVRPTQRRRALDKGEIVRQAPHFAKVAKQVKHDRAFEGIVESDNEEDMDNKPLLTKTIPLAVPVDADITEISRPPTAASDMSRPMTPATPGGSRAPGWDTCGGS